VDPLRQEHGADGLLAGPLAGALQPERAAPQSESDQARVVSVSFLLVDHSHVKAVRKVPALQRAHAASPFLRQICAAAAALASKQNMTQVKGLHA